MVSAPSRRAKLDRLGLQSASQIAAFTGLAATSVTALIDRLEARGLVKRSADTSDRRKVLVELEPRTKRPLAKPYAELAKATLALLTRYDDAALRAIADYLNSGAAYTEQQVAALAARSSAAANKRSSRKAARRP